MPFPPPTCTEPIDFPVFAAEYSSDRGCVVMGGGGGDSNTGVHNKLIMVRPGFGANGAALAICSERKVGKYEVDGLGISPKNGQVAASSADGCKLFVLTGDDRVTPISTDISDIPEQEGAKSAKPKGDKHMRKCEGLCFSLDGALLVASFCEMPKGMDSDDQEPSKIGVFLFPSLKLVCTIETELADGVRSGGLALSGVVEPGNPDVHRRLLCVNGRNHSCTVWAVDMATKEGLLRKATARAATSKGTEPEPLQSTPPTFTCSKLKALALPPVEATEQIRGCRFVSQAGKLRLLTGLNVRTKVGRRRKLSGSMVLWATEGEQMWTPLRREEVLADSGITAMCASDSGSQLFLGAGGSDGSTVVLRVTPDGTFSRVCGSSGDDMAVTSLAFTPAAKDGQAAVQAAKDGDLPGQPTWLVGSRLDKKLVGVQVKQEAWKPSAGLVLLMLVLLVLLAVYMLRR